MSIQQIHFVLLVAGENRIEEAKNFPISCDLNGKRKGKKASKHSLIVQNAFYVA